MKYKLFALSLFIIGISTFAIPAPEKMAQLVPLQPFPWSEVIETCPPCYKSNEVLHFGGNAKPFWNCPKSIAFVQKYLQNAQNFQSDADVLRFASDAVTIPGFYLQIGIKGGQSINYLAALNPAHEIYGFDSLDGLPKAWVKPHVTLPKGTFAFKNKGDLYKTIPFLKNIVIFPGALKVILPLFKQQILQNSPIAFLHIDCDLYESAKEVFDILGNNIGSGTVILFDEFYNYPGCEQFEWKAFQEFIAKRNLEVEYLAFNEQNEQVAVRIK